MCKIVHSKRGDVRAEGRIDSDERSGRAQANLRCRRYLSDNLRAFGDLSSNPGNVVDGQSYVSLSTVLLLLHGLISECLVDARLSKILKQ
jgi:hypothetical protein